MDQVEAAVPSSPVANNNDEIALAPHAGNVVTPPLLHSNVLASSSTTTTAPMTVPVAKEAAQMEGPGTELTNASNEKLTSSGGGDDGFAISSGGVDDGFLTEMDVEYVKERGIEHCDDPIFDCAKADNYICNKKRGVCCYVWNDRWNMTGLLLLIISLVVFILPNTPLRKGDQYQPPTPQSEEVCAAYRFSNSSNLAAGDDDYYRGMTNMPYINNTYSLCSACLRSGCSYCYRNNVPYCWGVDESHKSNLFFIKGRLYTPYMQYYNTYNTHNSKHTNTHTHTHTHTHRQLFLKRCALLHRQ